MGLRGEVIEGRPMRGNTGLQLRHNKTLLALGTALCYTVHLLRDKGAVRVCV